MAGSSTRGPTPCRVAGSKIGACMTRSILEWPSVSALLMAWRSTARLAASRTRRSYHGDFGSHWSTNTIHCGAGDDHGLEGQPGACA